MYPFSGKRIVVGRAYLFCQAKLACWTATFVFLKRISVGDSTSQIAFFWTRVQSNVMRILYEGTQAASLAFICTGFSLFCCRRGMGLSASIGRVPFRTRLLPHMAVIAFDLNTQSFQLPHIADSAFELNVQSVLFFRRNYNHKIGRAHV